MNLRNKKTEGKLILLAIFYIFIHLQMNISTKQTSHSLHMSNACISNLNVVVSEGRFSAKTNYKKLK